MFKFGEGTYNAAQIIRSAQEDYKVAQNEEEREKTKKLIDQTSEMLLQIWERPNNNEEVTVRTIEQRLGTKASDEEFGNFLTSWLKEQMKNGPDAFVFAINMCDVKINDYALEPQRKQYWQGFQCDILFVLIYNGYFNAN